MAKPSPNAPIHWYALRTRAGIAAIASAASFEGQQLA
jgi:hypothetical protein